MKAIAVIFIAMTMSTLGEDGATLDRLQACRQEIDSLDRHIVELIEQRARVVQKIGGIKREAHLPVAAPAREKQVIERAQELAKEGPLPADAVGRIYEKLVTQMRMWEAGLSGGTPSSPSSPTTR
jgi:chorismate mutase